MLYRFFAKPSNIRSRFMSMHLFYTFHICSVEVRKSRSYTDTTQDIQLIKYKYKKDINLLSTLHANAMQTVKENVEKPVIVVQYNKNMGGVDFMDKIIEPYNFARKTFKWYRKLAFRLFQVATVNAHIVYKSEGGDLPYAKFLNKVGSSTI